MSMLTVPALGSGGDAASNLTGACDGQGHLEDCPLGRCGPVDCVELGSSQTAPHALMGASGSAGILALLAFDSSFTANPASSCKGVCCSEMCEEYVVSGACAGGSTPCSRRCARAPPSFGAACVLAGLFTPVGLKTRKGLRRRGGLLACDRSETHAAAVLACGGCCGTRLPGTGSRLGGQSPRQGRESEPALGVCLLTMFVSGRLRTGDVIRRPSAARGDAPCLGVVEIACRGCCACRGCAWDAVAFAPWPTVACGSRSSLCTSSSESSISDKPKGDVSSIISAIRSSTRPMAGSSCNWLAHCRRARRMFPSKPINWSMIRSCTN
mmetsp:Transcript_65052/g.151094  ORF Transcript_65052/g.151094 Transcript_65052/m.151094 type:complete len:325 (-) Transcript_65052:631-1605(-)